MLSMGITLTLDDFRAVMKRPGVIALGFACCYVRSRSGAEASGGAVRGLLRTFALRARVASRQKEGGGGSPRGDHVLDLALQLRCCSSIIARQQLIHALSNFQKDPTHTKPPKVDSWVRS